MIICEIKDLLQCKRNIIELTSTAKLYKFGYYHYCSNLENFTFFFKIL